MENFAFSSFTSLLTNFCYFLCLYSTVEISSSLRRIRLCFIPLLSKTGWWTTDDSKKRRKREEDGHFHNADENHKLHYVCTSIFPCAERNLVCSSSAVSCSWKFKTRTLLMVSFTSKSLLLFSSIAGLCLLPGSG